MLTLTCKDAFLFFPTMSDCTPLRIDVRKEVVEPERFSEALFHELGLCQAAFQR